jgi:hypothetical protein
MTHGKESKRTGSPTAYWYTAPISGKKFTRVKAAWGYHDPSGGEARRVSDEAKEAAKKVAKEAAKEAARPAKETAKEATREAREAVRPAMEAAMEAAFTSATSIAKGDVMIRCGRTICQGTQKHTGTSWTHQFGKRKQIRCSSCDKRLDATKWEVGGRGRVRGSLKTNCPPTGPVPRH